VPVSIACIVPIAGLQWGLVMAATALSAGFLFMNFKATIYSAAPARQGLLRSTLPAFPVPAPSHTSLPIQRDSPFGAACRALMALWRSRASACRSMRSNAAVACCRYRRALLVLLLIVLAHVGLGLALKLYFFNY
jgi:hypothetical protein